MRHLTPLASVGLALCLAAAAEAKELWEYPWLEARSEHFIVQSALDEDKTRELIVSLEHFREVVPGLTSIRRFDERIPTKIYVLPKAMPALGFKQGAVGWFLPGMRANYAMLLPQGKKTDEVLKHEYLHFLLRNQGAQLFPPWLDDGFAELLSTLTVSPDGTSFEYGNSLEWRASSLNNSAWLPFRAIIESRNQREFGRDRMHMFYAQSWFLVHYLMIGRPGANSVAHITEYLKLTEAGTPPAEAFERAFGLKVSALARTLVSYARKAQYWTTTLHTPLTPANVTIKPAEPDAVTAGIALTALIRGERKTARELFGAALALNPNNALALVGMDDIARDESRWDEAVSGYERAIALEPNEANHELDYGEYFLFRAVREKEAAKRAAFITEARRHFFRSYKLNPDNPETLHQNGYTYLLEDSDPQKAVDSLEIAHQLLPSQKTIQQHLAQAYVAAKQPAKARPILQRLIAWSHLESDDDLGKLLAEVETQLAGDSARGKPPAPASE